MLIMTNVVLLQLTPYLYYNIRNIVNSFYGMWLNIKHDKRNSHSATDIKIIVIYVVYQVPFLF